MNNEFINEIKLINENIISMNASLKKFNTLKLDGITKYLIMPTTFMELKKVLLTIKKYNVKYHLIGNGSNIIFSSKEKECLIKLNFNPHNNDQIILANELLPILANKFLNKEYEGLEYLAMIPASVGGAIVMNAGAYNHNMSDIIEYVYYLDEDLKFKVLEKGKCEFSYRDSLFKDNVKIVLGCKIKLIHKNYSELKRIMYECKNKRKETQPIDYPNCGSIFKNGEDYKAWQLIEKSNLKGYINNGAMISEKHANFIINYDNATYNDVIYLIHLIENKVYSNYNIQMKKEIIIID